MPFFQKLQCVHLFSLSRATIQVFVVVVVTIVTKWLWKWLGKVSSSMIWCHCYWIFLAPSAIKKVWPICPFFYCNRSFLKGTASNVPMKSILSIFEFWRHFRCFEKSLVIRLGTKPFKNFGTPNKKELQPPAELSKGLLLTIDSVKSVRRCTSVP